MGRPQVCAFEPDSAVVKLQPQRVLVDGALWSQFSLLDAALWLLSGALGGGLWLLFGRLWFLRLCIFGLVLVTVVSLCVRLSLGLWSANGLGRTLALATLDGFLLGSGRALLWLVGVLSRVLVVASFGFVAFGHLGGLPSGPLALSAALFHVEHLVLGLLALLGIGGLSF